MVPDQGAHPDKLMLLTAPFLVGISFAVPKKSSTVDGGSEEDGEDDEDDENDPEDDEENDDGPVPKLVSLTKSILGAEDPG